MFANTEINITSEGHKHLGAVLGSRSVLEKYVAVSKFAEFAISQLQASYAAFIIGLRHCWIYFLRTISDIPNLLAPSECAISDVLIPAITDRRVTTEERNLIALPVRTRGDWYRKPIKSIISGTRGIGLKTINFQMSQMCNLQNLKQKLGKPKC